MKRSLIETVDANHSINDMETRTWFEATVEVSNSPTKLWPAKPMGHQHRSSLRWQSKENPWSCKKATE